MAMMPIEQMPDVSKEDKDLLATAQKARVLRQQLVAAKAVRSEACAQFREAREKVEAIEDQLIQLRSLVSAAICGAD